MRLAYALVTPERSHASLENFLSTSLAASLAITEEEIEDLKYCNWYGAHEEPSDEAWFDFVRLRRRVRRGE